jgi:hypothetical protein
MHKSLKITERKILNQEGNHIKKEDRAIEEGIMYKKVRAEGNQTKIMRRKIRVIKKSKIMSKEIRDSRKSRPTNNKLDHKHQHSSIIILKMNRIIDTKKRNKQIIMGKKGFLW